jgi:hypothetical protein
MPASRKPRSLSAAPAVASACNRRAALARLGAAVTFTPMGLAWAQDAAAPAPASTSSPLDAVGVYALLGESIQVVLSEDPEQAGGIFNRTEDIRLPGLGLDALALQAMKDALDGRRPAPRQHLFRATEAITLSEQRTIAEGARRGALPDWIIRSIEAHQLSHVLLLTRDRGPAQFTRPDGSAIGRGQVEGIGFYIDPIYQPRNLLTGAPPLGALGVYVEARLSLFDTRSASVVAEQRVRASRLHVPATEAQGVEPWSILDSRRKIEALREIVGATLRRDVPLALPA